MKFYLMFFLIVATNLLSETLYFSYTETSKAMTIRIKSDALLKINGENLATDDEIGAFTQDGTCVGAVVWENSTTAFSVYGETATPPVDGLESGESIVFKIWDSSEDFLYENVEVSLKDFLGNPINDEFDTSVPYKDIVELTGVYEPLSKPVLISPENQQDGAELIIEFDWEDMEYSDYYRFQLSDDANFSNIIKNQTNITNSNYDFNSSLNTETTYFWRVKSFNEYEESDWSDTFSFKTLSIKTISLNQGWNIISSNVFPNNISIENIFSDISNKIDLVKNDEGIYIPNEINTLGEWNNYKSYVVFCNSSTQLEIKGVKAVSTNDDVNLSEGWNYFPVLTDNDLNLLNTINSISNELIIIKGVSEELYLPVFGFQTFNTFQSGRGYYIYVNQDVNFDITD